MMNPSKILIFYLGFALMLVGVVSAAQIWEVPYDIENDPDIDHLTTSEELKLGTDPNNRDTDGDGLTDGNEFLAKTNPLVNDTDDDGFDDRYEYYNKWHGFDPVSASVDMDGDGLEDKFENMIGTYPDNTDSDGDGYRDKFEYDNSFYGWEPAKKNFDDDGDGLTNAKEKAIGTDTKDRDTDGDSYTDKIEYELQSEGYDPLSTSFTELRALSAAAAVSCEPTVKNESSDFPSQYRTYDEYETEIGDLFMDNQDITSIATVGHSWERTQGLNWNTIWGLKIAANSNKPKVVYLGNHHAREIITTDIALEWANWLIDGYRSGDPDATWIVNNREVWIVPMVNPDGHRIVETAYPLHRKNAHWYSATQRNEPPYKGVDLNRNYDWKWGTIDDSSNSHNPEDNTYIGPSSSSEPEVQNISDFIAANDFRQGITWHSYGGMVITPWAYDLTLADKELTWLGDQMKSVSGYIDWDEYAAAGVFEDNAFQQKGLLGYTVEAFDTTSWSEGCPSETFAGYFNPIDIDVYNNVIANNIKIAKEVALYDGYPLSDDTPDDNELYDDSTGSDNSDVYSFDIRTYDFGGIGIKPPYDYNLYVYTDYGLTNLLESSTQSGTKTDFVIIDGHSLGSRTTYYAKVSRDSSAGGTYQIEMENSIPEVTPDYTAPHSFTSNEVIDMYDVYLPSGSTYYFEADPVAGLDVELFLFDDTGTRNEAVIYSSSGGSGVKESFAYTGAGTTYGIVVTRKTGSGNYNLTVSFVDNNPPSQSNWYPAKGSTILTNSPTMRFSTDENAWCRWSLSDQGYDSMAGDCTGDGTTSQSCATSGLSEGSVIVYTACQDSIGNKDTAATNEHINYIVDPNAPPSTWSDPTRLTSTLINNDSRWANAVIDSKGNTHIAYNEYLPNGEIWYTKLDKNGNVLVEEKQITVSDGYQSRCPVLAVDSNDNIHITFCDDRSGHLEPYYIKLDNNGTPLTGEVRIGFAQKNDPRSGHIWSTIAIDSNDYVHVVWTASPNDNTTYYQTEVYYSKLYNNGTILISNIRITNLASHKFHTTIAIDSNNDLHIAWKDRMLSDGREEIFYTKLDNNGFTLVDDTRLTFTSKNSVRPWITIDSDDNVNIVWMEGKTEYYYGSTDSDLYYMKLDNNGNKIIDDTRLTFNPAPIYNHVASSPMDSKDNIHIAWNENRAGTGTQIYYMKINTTGDIITNETRLTGYPSMKMYGVHTALYPDDRVFVTWTDNRDGNNEIYYKISPLPTDNISLSQGWNLVSLPLTPENTSIDAVLASIEGNYTVVYAWIDGAWKKSTASRNPLAEMTVEYGYWIDMTVSDTLELSGIQPASTTINVSTGWNLVGYPSLTARNLTDVLSTVNYSVVYAWIGGAWKKSTASRNPLTDMNPGYGYWIDANGAGSYEVLN